MFLFMSLAAALLQSPRALILALLLLSAGILGSAFVFQYAWGYAPCALCLEQRQPWWALIALGFILLYLPVLWRGLPGRALIGLCAVGAVLALYNAGLGGYHAGIEWKWWPGPPSCTSTGLGLSTDLGDLSGIRPVMCDEAGWRMFGLSMAGYNVLASLAAAAIMGLAGWRLFQVARVFALLQPGLRQLAWKGLAR